jgi:hypothetical protein
MLLLFLCHTGYLNLYNNMLTGTLPSGLNLRQLWYFDVGYNNMEGPLPTDWWEGNNDMKRLRNLFVNNNRFTGTIPEAFTTMGNGRMSQVILHDNEFSGTFPGGWNPTNFLSSIEIQNTNIQAIDKDVCNLIVFTGGELTILTADCSICTCDPTLCDPPRCVN